MSVSELADVLKTIENITNLKEEVTSNDESYSFGSLDYSNSDVGILTYTYLIQKRNEVKLITLSNSFEYETVGLYSNTRLLNMLNEFNSTYMGFKAFILEKRKENRKYSIGSKKEMLNTVAVTFNTDLIFHRQANLFKDETKKSFSICLHILGNAPSLFSEMMAEYGINHKSISNENM